MVPLVELKGAIPVGVSMGLGIWQSLIVSVLGNMVPVPFIILFIRQIFAWLRRKSAGFEKMITSLEGRVEGKWDKVRKYQMIGLFILVADPLPGTGAWTGALIAALLNMRMRNAVPTIFLAVVVAGILITGLTYGFTSIF
ncbi:MAG TPA: small multidrug export protein [Clostridiales bacterium]|nr:small multidrug export protein [Clostridiales bacterium]HBR08274.1 small multidrug export protein [Clostridiales bacterium]